MKKILFFISFLFCVLISNAQTTVKYTVSCNPAGFNVTYINDVGITEKKIVSDSIWTISFNSFPKTSFNIVAQSNNTNAIIKVKIEYEYSVRQSTATGNYPIATTSGFLKY